MVTSKLPVVPGSSLGTTVIWSPNSPSRVSFSALKYFPYPHPPQYWMETVQWSDMVDVAVRREVGWAGLRVARRGVSRRSPGVSTGVKTFSRKQR